MEDRRAGVENKFKIASLEAAVTKLEGRLLPLQKQLSKAKEAVYAAERKVSAEMDELTREYVADVERDMVRAMAKIVAAADAAEAQAAIEQVI
jgi:CII-binding regulator of phage lambda lysogenization HflD